MTTSAPGSPWALASSAGGMQTREIGEPTLPDHEEQGGDVAERTGPTGPHHPRQQSQSLQAADELSAPGIPQGYGAGARREERPEQREEQIARMTPHGSGGELSPQRPISSGLALSRKALDAQFCRDRNPPVAHDAHVHSRSNAQATLGKTGPANAGGQGNAPCDKESRAAGVSQEGENVVPRTNIQTHGEQAIADKRSGERENGGGTSGGHGNGSVTPCIKANEETAAIAATAAAGSQRDDRRGGSPAYRRGPPTNDEEANAPGAPQPLRRSARRTPHAQAPPEARIRLRAEPDPDVDPQSADGSHPQTPAEQQVRSRQDVREEADGEQDQPLRRSHGPEHQGSPSAPAQGTPLAQDEPITPISQAQQAAPAQQQERGSGRRQIRRPQPPPDQALSASHLALRDDLFEIAMSWDSTTLTSTSHLPIVRRRS
ncbi:unnamed protein product [Closterium sp. Naga37s-1]|nr:unnamed protein product [Closterium sp. Naga37s-1]